MNFEKRQKAVSKLITLYEKSLGSVLDTSHKFETHRLPQHIQDMLEVVVAKAPNFSNIAALATTNHVVAHVIGQTRAAINDPVFSADHIGINIYTCLLSGSG